MATITPNTTTIQDCDDVRLLLAKILHRLNLNSGAQVDVPAANVAVTNTPLPIAFDGPQQVDVIGQPHVLVDNATLDVAVTNTPNVAVTNFPVTQQVAGTVNVGNTPNVSVVGTARVDFAPTARDAFGRLRVSQPSMLFDAKNLIDGESWSDVQASGAGTSSTFSQNRASYTLGVTAATAGRRVRQSKRHFNYQAARGHLILATFVLGTAGLGITRRVGYFDDENGVFFQESAGNFSFVVRSKATGVVVDDVIPRANWNGDKLDGTGPSGYIFNQLNAQIFWCDLEWLGVGTVRFGFVINGEYIVCHQDHHANVLTSVYMSSPNLPLRFEISNTGAGGSASFETICAAVASEGGEVAPGRAHCASRGATSITTNNDANLYPIVAIRLRSPYGKYAEVLPTFFSSLCTSSANYEWQVIMNPTVAGPAVTWTPLSPGVEAALAPVTANQLTGGTLIASGYIASGQNASILETNREVALGVTYAGVSDEVWLAVRRLSTSAETFYGSLGYTERG